MLALRRAAPLTLLFAALAGEGAPSWADTSSRRIDPLHTGQVLKGGHRVLAVARFRGHTYAAVDHPDGMSWKTAQGLALGKRGHLATVSDLKENDLIVSLFQRPGTRGYWIGMSDERNEGTWEWVTGEPVRFTNWHDGEPNDASGGEDVAAIWADRGGTWNDGVLDDRAHADGCVIEFDC